MSSLVVGNLNEADEFFSEQKLFIRNFVVTVDIKNAMFRICNPKKKYVTKSIDLIMTQECKAPVFMSRRVRLEAKEAAIMSFNELSVNKQVRVVPNTISQSAAILERSFSITKGGFYVSFLLNTLDKSITVQMRRKLGYGLPVKIRFEVIEIIKMHEVPD